MGTPRFCCGFLLRFERKTKCIGKWGLVQDDSELVPRQNFGGFSDLRGEKTSSPPFNFCLHKVG